MVKCNQGIVRCLSGDLHLQLFSYASEWLNPLHIARCARDGFVSSRLGSPEKGVHVIKSATSEEALKFFIKKISFVAQYRSMSNY